MSLTLPIARDLARSLAHPIVHGAAENQGIIVAGQSNAAGRQTAALGGSLISPDDDQHPRVYKYTGTGTRALVTMPVVFPDGHTYDTNVTPSFAHAKRVAGALPSSKIAILPFAFGGLGLDGWVAGQVRFNNMAAAWSAFRAEFPDNALHSILISCLEDEMANAITPANVATRLDASIAAFRALPGAATVPIILMPPVPEWITAGGDAYRLILLEGAKAAVRHSNVGIIGGELIGTSLSGDAFLHYPNDEQRLRGAAAYDQIARIAAFNASAPPTVTVHSLNSSTLEFTSVGAPYYDIQTSPPGAGTWSPNLFVPNQNNSPGQQFSLGLPGSGSRDYRIVARSKGDGGIGSISSVGNFTDPGGAGVALTDSEVIATDLSTFTFPAVSLGAASASRLIIVGGGFRAVGAPTITSVKIHVPNVGADPTGITATIDVEARNTSNQLTSAFIARAVVPTGTTGDVVVTISAAAVHCGIVTYRTTTYNGAAPTKTGTATRTSTPGTMSPNLAAPDAGFQIGVAYNAGGTNRRITSASALGSVASITVDCQDNASSWTGLTEDVDAVMEAGVSAVMAAASAGWKYP